MHLNLKPKTTKSCRNFQGKAVKFGHSEIRSIGELPMHTSNKKPEITAERYLSQSA